MLDTSGWQTGPPFVDVDEAETFLINAMAAEAAAYIHSFPWAPRIAQMFFSKGVGGVIAPFLVRFDQAGAVDEELWVVVGDVPSAYLVTDAASTARQAVEQYCALMEDWVEAVRNRRSLSNVYPVAAEPNPDNAAALALRLRFIREQIVPGL